MFKEYSHASFMIGEVTRKRVRQNKRSVIDMTGTLKITRKKNDSRLIFVEHDSRRNMPVFPGQYVYLSVEDARIPVLVQYSTRKKKWYFAGLPGMELNNREVSIKKKDCA